MKVRYDNDDDNDDSVPQVGNDDFTKKQVVFYVEHLIFFLYYLPTLRWRGNGR